MPDSEVRFDPRATVENRWDSFPSNCIGNILISSIRNGPGDPAESPVRFPRKQSSFRCDKPSHVTPRVFGPSNEGDERDYARFLTCCLRRRLRREGCGHHRRAAETGPLITLALLLRTPRPRTRTPARGSTLERWPTCSAPMRSTSISGPASSWILSHSASTTVTESELSERTARASLRS